MTEAATDSGVAFRAGKLESVETVPVTEGAPGVDVGQLLAQGGVVTYDPGYRNTGACKSEITYIDGDAGILRYRGYPIGELAEQSSFLEVSYLLIHGELPSATQLDHFAADLRRHTLLDEDFRRLFDGFPRDAHPMPVLSSAVSALSTFYQESLDPFSDEQVGLSTIRLMAKLPTIAACAYKKSVGQPFIYPDNSLGLVENFLAMLFILHADHEQNCSTSTVRLVGSAQANLFASISAGINALFGPLHGGANSAVMTMLEGIRDDGGDVGKFVAQVKDRQARVKLMGFGHAVYRNYDPRAAIVKKAADEVIAATGNNDHLLDIALELESVALQDDYFISRKLYPNVDFYTGLLYRAMGFPTSMFTVLFAIGRLPGWIAQWHEMVNDPDTKIGRPRQLYTGPAERPYIPISHRS
jgi:citrate synthase